MLQKIKAGRLKALGGLNLPLAARRWRGHEAKYEEVLRKWTVEFS